MQFRPSDVDDRVAREKEFHDQPSDLRNLIDRLNKPVATELEAALLSNLENVAGLDVLHFGCGAGDDGIAEELNRRDPRSLISFDLATNRVREAKRRRSQSGELFMVADAHRLPVSTASVDLVVGLAILHHLDLAVALAEIRRVLRANGRLVVAEPLAYHPLAALGRLLTPSARTPDEQPFRRRELKSVSQSFDVCKRTYVHLLAPILAWPLAVVSRNAAAWVVSKVSPLDRRLTTRFPGLGYGCWYVIVDARTEGRLTDT